MEIIKDLRTLNKLGRLFNLTFDKEFKYIIKEDISIKGNRDLNKLGYEIKYLSGCFYPYICTH